MGSPEASVCYGDIRADLEKRGEVIGGNDLWISALAMAEGLIPVTKSEREFRRVKLQSKTGRYDRAFRKRSLAS